jgi:Uma2 family endonuclease
MSSTAVQQRYTPEQYLALERRAVYKSEYINGHIMAMAGASRQHNLIAGNLYREVSQQLRGRPCEAYISYMRVKVSHTGLYTYPDVVMVCGGIHFEDANNDTLLNPTAIVEVLSVSTEAYDRGEKFPHYRRLESLQEYLLVAQDKVRIEHYVRQGAQWVLSEISDINDTVHLAAVDCAIALQDVYDKVQFAERGEESPLSNE